MARSPWGGERKKRSITQPVGLRVCGCVTPAPNENPIHHAVPGMLGWDEQAAPLWQALWGPNLQEVSSSLVHGEIEVWKRVAEIKSREPGARLTSV